MFMWVRSVALFLLSAKVDVYYRSGPQEISHYHHDPKDTRTPSLYDMDEIQRIDAIKNLKDYVYPKGGEVSTYYMTDLRRNVKQYGSSYWRRPKEVGENPDDIKYTWSDGIRDFKKLDVLFINKDVSLPWLWSWGSTRR
eukprot:GHVU01223330.1.p1 GENE.GHVU01223330.1~~GHVU01223330.1.p1  ORF type:complete len:139 (-),score=14.80 GHVU01223330.1:610-1026(-)